MLSSVKIVNMALRKFGATPIEDFDEETPSGQAVRDNYNEVVRGLLSEYPWSFTKRTERLARIAVEPDASGRLDSGWRYAFSLPNAALAPPEKYLSDPNSPYQPLRFFEVQGATFFADVETVWAAGRFAPEPESWPAYFVTAAIACLAAELVMPICSNSSIRDKLAVEAWGTPTEGRRGGKLGAAKLADARSQPSARLPNDPLNDARR